MLGRVVEETFAELLYVSPLRNIYHSTEHDAPRREMKRGVLCSPDVSTDVASSEWVPHKPTKL